MRIEEKFEGSSIFSYHLYDNLKKKLLNIFENYFGYTRPPYIYTSLVKRKKEVGTKTYFDRPMLAKGGKKSQR